MCWTPVKDRRWPSGWPIIHRWRWYAGTGPVAMGKASVKVRRRQSKWPIVSICGRTWARQWRKTITAHRADLMELAATPIRAAKKPPKIVQPPPEKKVVARHRVHYEQVQKLTAQGLSRAAIGRKLGLHTATVRKFATARSFDDVIAVCDNRSTILDDYKEYLHQRWNAGEGNAAALSREIAEFGYTGTEQQVQRYLRRFRHGLHRYAPWSNHPASVRSPPGSWPTRLTWTLTPRSD